MGGDRQPASHKTTCRRTLCARIVAVGLIVAAVGAGTGVEPAQAAGPQAISYGSNSSQTALVFPSGEQKSPTVVLVHGGGFTGGSASDNLTLAEALWLQRQGVTVVDVNYRLASAAEGGLSAEVADIVSAVRWTRVHAAQYEGDPAKLTLFGGSAGATLAALAARITRPRHVVDLSGINDISSEVQVVLAHGVAEWQPMAAGLTRVLGCELASCSTAALLQYSPTSSPDRTATWLVGSAADDPFVPIAQAQAMVAAVTGRGGHAELDVVDGTAHAFELDMALNVRILRLVER
jgi:acetyl esterase/lipase